VIDADTINPCVGLYLGLENASAGTMEVLLDKADISKVIIPHPTTGIRILPGIITAIPYNVEEFKPSEKQIQKFFESIGKLSYDFIILDTQPGVAFPEFPELYDEAVVVTVPRTASCISAIKMLNEYKKVKLKTSLVVNMVANKKYELTITEIEDMAEIRVAATLPEDENVLMSVADRMPVYLFKKEAPFSKAIDELAGVFASRIDTIRHPDKGTKSSLFKFIKKPK